MKHFVIEPNTTKVQVLNLRRLARRIANAEYPFNMDNPTICALGNARSIGLLQPTGNRIHPGKCGCQRCGDYHKLAKDTGVSVDEWVAIFAKFQFSNNRKEAAKYFRQRARELA